MNRDKVAELMKRAGISVGKADVQFYCLIDGVPEELQRFATLVAAAEREACAKVCDKMAAECRQNWSYDADAKGTSYELAGAAIRARNTNKATK